ncbi:uncharacterized protein LACBIDRAFT_330002 [Laccaria bicolor S238N-H82]|uniref:Predicted protein n=1 Tax=Laccaria bicolor (strain S238N-H82 / ATCC MYA-4686) TaxID=486041 RepID=B0DJW1_LACBS|nr:uncharacterized protein LACBIDRAFT_330002 [Laccaria bicolor S238N-H82]EDR05277.1 predicted protein [Laccaria bicolor S238N-H82]|eukprot:XP_001884242.1 predicted protein [Laccaria bicolor S238N-H82]
MFLEVPLRSASKLTKNNPKRQLTPLNFLCQQKGPSHLLKRISVPSHIRNEIEKRTYAQTLPDNSCIFMGSMKTTVFPFIPHGACQRSRQPTSSTKRSSSDEKGDCEGFGGRDAFKECCAAPYASVA